MTFLIYESILYINCKFYSVRRLKLYGKPQHLEMYLKMNISKSFKRQTSSGRISFASLFWSYKRNKIFKMDLRRIRIELTQK